MGDPEMTRKQLAPDIWQVAWGAKNLIAIGVVVGLTLGYLALKKFGPSFDASARILVTKKIPKQIKEDDRDISSLGDRAEHIHIILSPKVILPAIKKHQLDKLVTLKGDPEADRSILDALRVKRVGGQEKSTLNVFDLSFNWGNEQDAQQILNAVIDSYNDYLVSTRKRHGVDSVESIRNAADKVLIELRNLEVKYSAFRQSAPLIWKNAVGANGGSGDTTNVYQQRVLEYEAARRENRKEITKVKAKTDALEDAIRRKDSPENLEILIRKLMQLDGGSITDAAAGNGEVSSLENALIPLLVEEAKLVRAGFGPNYYGLRTVRDSISKVRDFYRRQGIVLPEEKRTQGKDGTALTAAAPPNFIEIYRLMLKYEIDALDKRDVELTSLFEAADRDAKRFDHYLTQDKQFNDDILRLRTLHNEEVNRLDKARLVVDDQGYIMEEISPVFTEKSMKRPIQCLGMGGALGVAIAFGFAYLRAMTDNRLKSAADLRANFGQPILGQIPTFTAVSLQAATRNRPDLDPTLYYLTRPGSIEAEAYRAVRTALFFRCQKTGQKVIQVTSPEPQDGKTTLAANLALAIAHAGKRVILVDADLRCPKVHTIFRLRHDIGLSDVILGEIRYENAIQTCELEGLSLLSAGITPANPAELLGSAEFERLLKELRNEFDYVIVDTPPLMAVSDPCIVGSRVDALLLVARLHKNRLSTLGQSFDLLRNNGVSVLGTVVNDDSSLLTQSYGGAYKDAYVGTSRSSGMSKPVAVTSPTVTLPVYPTKPV